MKIQCIVCKEPFNRHSPNHKVCSPGCRRIRRGRGMVRYGGQDMRQCQNICKKIRVKRTQKVSMYLQGYRRCSLCECT